MDVSTTPFQKQTIYVSDESACWHDLFSAVTSAAGAFLTLFVIGYRIGAQIIFTPEFRFTNGVYDVMES